MSAPIHDAIDEVLTTRRRDAESVPVIKLMRQVERGISVNMLDRVMREIAPDDASFVFRIIPKATLSRRRRANALHDTAKAVLSQEEGGRVARLADVWAAAKDVWGSAEAARAFLFRPHPLLGGEKPIDVALTNEFGRPVVLDILGGLKHGTAI